MMDDTDYPNYAKLIDRARWRLRAAKALEEYSGQTTVGAYAGYELLRTILKKDISEHPFFYTNDELEICKSLCGPNGRTIFKAWCIKNGRN